ncbi:Short-chain-fatty-acid--CoA ligase [Variovorax sp. SRS16]|uniref:class I adenylate-forming enzyme family protein n=1 Tax=Variovorax sp. SRS16 TaxID=282217 RepID=UPI001319639F|nr:AMP-binding protein [Variovorax sp. SRS16]VTU29796.1 Short-chain-fatty-acid--CoA ligase [Variovorax sp. SRS16]
MKEWFRRRTIGMLPAQAARRWGRNEALAFNGQRWTYAQFDVEVDRVARALIGAGVAPGERVAVWMTNRPEFLYLFYAICKVGAVFVPLNTRYRTLDLSHGLRQCGCATFITVERSGPIDYLDMAREVLGEVDVGADGLLRSSTCPDLRRVVVFEQGALPGALSWTTFMQGATDAADGELERRAAAVDPDAAALIIYTSGTTGKPKGVMLSHIGIRLMSERAAALGLTSSDVCLNNLPLFHIYSLGNIALHSIVTGARQVVTETFDAEQSLRLIESERVTMLSGFDTHYRDLIHQKARLPAIDTSSLRVGHFGAGLKNVEELAHEIQRKLCPTVGAYGMTECWGAVSHSFLDATLDQRTQASGYPLPDVELRVVDPQTGLDLQPGEQGEILIRSYTNMLGYYRQPEATAQTIDGEGWIHSGDAGILRTDGHLRFTGRYKDMLKVGGDNVSPAEVEHLLLQMPGISEAAVIGCPDLRLHEVVAAFVVTATDAQIGLPEVDAFCRGKIASFKIPRRVVVVDALPLTPSGKVQKQLLRDRLREISD